MGLFDSVGSAIGKVVGSFTGATQQAEAAGKAADVQASMSQAGIDEQRRQFDALVKLMSPYVMSGNAAMQQQLALLGLEMRPVQKAATETAATGTAAKNSLLEVIQKSGGTSGGSNWLTSLVNSDEFKKIFEQQSASKGTTQGGGAQEFEIVESSDAQKRAIAALEQSPFFQSMYQQGENAMLQQASATGGIRGGNIQGALAQFRPGLLNQMVQQRFSQLGGLTQLGQASAAGQAAQGMQSAGAVGDLLAQMGAAQAGGIMAKGSRTRQVFGDIMQIAGAASGAYKSGMFGGAKAPIP